MGPIMNVTVYIIGTSEFYKICNITIPSKDIADVMPAILQNSIADDSFLAGYTSFSIIGIIAVMFDGLKCETVELDPVVVWPSKFPYTREQLIWTCSRVHRPF